MSEQRKNNRFELRKKERVDFYYDFEADVSVSKTNKAGIGEKHMMYHATAKNVSCEGLCFQSNHQLIEGDLLDLEYYIPGISSPVHMQGEVRWSKAETAEDEGQYSTGVRVRSIEGKKVDGTVYFDENYHLYWSDVLESVLGTYRVLKQEKKNEE